MALSSIDLLAAIVAALSSHAGGLHRLAIHYARARLDVSPDTHAQALSERGMQLLPGTVDAPADSEVVMNGLPGREVARKQARRVKPVLKCR
jgi:hypothetical protein